MLSDIATVITAVTLLAANQIISPLPEEKLLAVHQISLETRQPDSWVNGIFQDNILLNLAYMDGRVRGKADINWDEIRKPATLQFKLQPGEVFAFHGDVLKDYEGKVAKTANADFNVADGFKTDGYLYGDGVCHLASLIYWVALDARLKVQAPSNHNFMAIPEISKEYGVSIYKSPGAAVSNAQQNLYVTNNKEKPIEFRFEYKNNNLKLSIFEI